MSGEPLVVATTGDHPPFSVGSNGAYEGISIELANDLGAALGRRVRFVETTWPSLIADAVAERFDVALSGIHVTSEREAAVDFTMPYLAVGKRAVVRCADLGRFGSLEDLNRPGAQFFVTRGASDEHFVRQNFPSAVTIQTLDAADAVEQLASGEGDVLFGDPFFTAHHLDNNPRLCLGLGGVLVSEYPIAVLLPPRSPLLEPANRWMRERRADGFIRQVLENHSALGAGRLL